MAMNGEALQEEGSPAQQETDVTPIEKVEISEATSAVTRRSTTDSEDLHSRVKRARSANRITSVSPQILATPRLQRGLDLDVVYAVGTVGHITHNRICYSLDNQIAAIKMKACGIDLDTQTGMKPIGDGCCLISWIYVQLWKETFET